MIMAMMTLMITTMTVSKVRPMSCGNVAVGCGYSVSIGVPFLTGGPMMIYRGTDGRVKYDEQFYSRTISDKVTITNTGIFTDIAIKGKITVRLSEGEREDRGFFALLLSSFRHLEITAPVGWASNTNN